MQKIDPAFLFELGPALRRIRDVTEKSPLGYAAFLLVGALEQIDMAVDGSIYAHLIRGPARQAKSVLVTQIRAIIARNGAEGWSNELVSYDAHVLSAHYTKFETLLLADLQAAALYLVYPKGGYDTDRLTEAGELVFSSDLSTKVPEALGDLKAATRCVAFELPTAAGFHLHRAHETVLRSYWDCVTGGAPRPKENNMGVYLSELDKLDKGKKAIRSHLRSIKDFHRNPLMHPEQSLETVDESIDLLAAIRCSIGYMLSEIPADLTPLLAAIDAINANAASQPTVG